MANYELGNLVWRITGDDSGLKKSVKGADKQINSFGSKVKKVGAMVAGAFAIGGVVKFTKSIVQAASRAEETANKFGVVFSSIQDDAQAAAKNLQENFGLAGVEAQELLSDTGDLLTGFGLTQEKSLELADAAAQLGTDLASFTNYAGGAQGATQALAKAMLGEREQVKLLGIALTETDLKKFAEEQGVAWDEADRGTKAMLTLELATRQSKNAVGDFARSSDSAANIHRKLVARMTDLKTELGKELLPVLSDLGAAFLDTAKDGGVLMDFMKGSLSVIGFYIKGLANLVRIVQVVSNSFEGYIEEQRKATFERGIEASLGRIKEEYGSIKKAKEAANAGDKKAAQMIDIYRMNLEKAQGSAEKLVDLANDNVQLGDDLSDKIEEQNKKIQDAIDKRKDEKDAQDGITESTENTGDAVDGVDKAWQKQNKSIQEANDLVQGFGSQLMGMFSAAAELSDARYDKRLEQLDAQMEAELEAAGLSEQTAVEKAQAELDAAKKSGKAEEIEEKKKQLAKAKIEEKYQKKRAELEYQSELSSWKWRKTEAQAGVPLAIMNALASGWAAGPALGPILGPLYASMAGAAAIMQLAAVNAAKPEPPKFATGGIVPGNQRTGDNMSIRANSGEMVLNEAQQSRLLNIADGGGGGNNMRKVAPITREMTWQEIFDASQRGELFISERAIQRT